MRIAMIFDGLGLGGIERVGVDYIKLLSNRGHKIDVYNLLPSAKILENELPEQVKIIHYKLPRKSCPYMYMSSIKRWWWGTYIYLPVYIGLSLWQNVRRSLFSKKEQYDIAIAFSGHFNDLTFLEKNYIKTKKKVCWLHGGLVDYALMSSGYLKLYQKLKNIVTLSSNMETEVLNVNSFLKELNIKKIYNPTYIGDKVVDKEVVVQLKEKYGDFLLMVGRFTKEKDQKTVVKAVKILFEKYNVKNKLLFVGDGEEEEEVKRYAAQLGMNEQIIFMGRQIHVQNYYAAAKLFLHSSPAEGLPTVLIEAMSFGIPVVATKSMPGVPEILDHGKYGHICEIGNAEEMAEQVYQILSDENEYKKYSDLGCKRSKDFSPEKIGNQVEEFLNSLK